MSKAADIFRKASLERLASPEQLDQRMRVTSSRAWMMLIAMGLLISTVVVWSVLGSIATKVEGSGVLIKGGGVQEIVATDAGQIVSLYVRVGEEVQKGQIVARLAQPDLAQQLEKSKAKLEELRNQHQRMKQLGSEDTQARASYLSSRRSNLLLSMRADRERVSWLTERLRKQERLASQGLVTKGAVQATRAELRQAREDISNARNQLQSLSVSSLESKGAKEKEVLSSELAISEGERQLELLTEKLELSSRVISPHTGRVLEIRVSEGSVVGPGYSLLTLEPTGSEGSGLEAVIFVPVGKGKSIEPGMRVQVSPASVKKEEFGVMLGIVTVVSEFPATQAGMKRILQNDLLVKNLLQTVGLAPIAVTAELVPDAATTSGYKWSSKEGPPTEIGPGTPIQSTITVREIRPITKVIPLLREYLGV